MVSYILHATISVSYQFVLSSRKPDPSVSQRRSAAHVPILKAIGAVDRKGSGLRDLNALGWNLREVPNIETNSFCMDSLYNHNIRGWYNDIHIVWGRKLFTISLGKHDNFLHYTLAGVSLHKHIYYSARASSYTLS